MKRTKFQWKPKKPKKKFIGGSASPKKRGFKPPVTTTLLVLPTEAIMAPVKLLGRKKPAKTERQICHIEKNEARATTFGEQMARYAAFCVQEEVVQPIWKWMKINGKRKYLGVADNRLYTKKEWRNTEEWLSAKAWLKQYCG